MKLLPHRSRSAGFTLVEIGVVVAVLGLLVAIAIPGYKRLTERSTNTVLNNDVRAAKSALEYYAFEKGSWPPDGAGSWPTEVIGYLPPPDRWNKPTPIGGTWAWALDTDDTVASIRINNYTIPASQVAKLDAMIDNGNPADGNCFAVGTALVFVLEK